MGADFVSLREMIGTDTGLRKLSDRDCVTRVLHSQLETLSKVSDRGCV